MKVFTVICFQKIEKFLKKQITGYSIYIEYESIKMYDI